MGEGPSEFSEDTPERILSRAEVIAALERHVQGYEIARELTDDQGGIYMLEVKVSGEKPGEVNEYTYQRKGNFGKNQSSATTISVAYYDADGIPEGGKTLGTLDEATGEWK